MQRDTRVLSDDEILYRPQRPANAIHMPTVFFGNILRRYIPAVGNERGETRPFHRIQPVREMLDDDRFLT